MSLSEDEKQQVVEVIKQSIRNKFKSYNPETKHMPFHYRLLGKDRMALFSFIQSLNTTFGTSIYEPVAIALAKGRFAKALTQVSPYNYISAGVHTKIQEIMDQLRQAVRDPDKKREVDEIRKVCRIGSKDKVRLTKVDIWLEDFKGDIFMIDMKTAKPNVSGFQKYKQTLLEWVAAELARNPDAEVHSLIAIPYNPYEPEPYKRWTIRGMLDLKHELLVADELWDFIGGKGTYKDLLDCFEVAGIALRPEIDQYFARFEKGNNRA